MYRFPGFILSVLVLALPLILVPVKVERFPTIQQMAEQTVRHFLASHGPYMAIYFSDVDTAFSELEDEPAYQQLAQRLAAYQDSTVRFSRIDFAKADSYYTTYRNLNLEKDSMRIHFKPRPLGWLIIHHFQLEGKPWTDSFMLDFQFTRILKAREAVD